MDNLAAPVPQPAPAWRAALRGNVLAMGLVSLFTDFSSEMMNPLLPIFFAGLVGGPRAAFWVGVSEGIAEATASLLKMASGRLSDKLGKRKALVLVGYGLSSISRPLMALAGLLGSTPGGRALQVVGLKFADRVGKGVRTSPRDALIGDSVPKDFRGLAFSFHRSMDHAGAVLGPLVALGMLYAFLGYARWGEQSVGSGIVPPEEMAALRWLFATAVIPGVIAMVVLFRMVREVPPAAQATRPAVPVAQTGLWRQLPRRFYVFVGVVALFALGNSSDMFLLLYGWQLFGMSMQQLILLWILLHMSKIVFSIPGGAISDRIGRRPVIVAGWFIYALVYLGMAIVGSRVQGIAAAGQAVPLTYQLWFWGLFLVYGFYFGMSEGAERALVTDFVSSEHRGTAFGIYNGAVGIAALPASLLFGVFWTQIGPTWAFGIGAALAGLAAILLLALVRAGAGET